MESTNNPYAPPKTRELELPSEPAPKQCKHVDWACKLMWIGLAFSTLDLILTTLFTLDSDAFTAELVGGLVGLGFVLALVYWFTLKLRAGRNWMRWLVTILTICGVLAVAFMVPVFRGSMFATIFPAGRPQVAIFGIQIILAVVELVLINTPAARQWFHARSNY